MKERYTIPCLHEAGATGRHPDYYPLIITDVVHLVSKAREAKSQGDRQTVSSILSRLTQAIPDQTCPRTSGSHAEEVENRLSEYFTGNLQQHGADPSFTEEIMRILAS